MKSIKKIMKSIIRKKYSEINHKKKKIVKSNFNKKKKN